ncbi:haloacid dehalogenase, type II [Thioalkalivibrio denitrificans]|uniref:(S)-2-haloacid dehalogenase n=1 Tax=Thioalkalivibrio denitrificans TaxID=108003 RepID=A0A1V3NST8_9GAMM|nr:haloacid dehalogenase type II [Thioalkalivibrio denitrificans]OOG27806.1 haloacid dehalogenase, type II [Thioalkalivibrio denitrificans]
MPATLAFDIYGTLIDTNGVVTALREMPAVGDRAAEFSRVWREKQLEYTFRRGLMQNYADFSVCTRQALDYLCAAYRIDLGGGEKERLLEVYRVLPAYDDVVGSLERLSDAGFRMHAFSNGSATAVETLLTTAGVRDFFLGVVSVEDLRSFKPNPAVYAHFLRRAGATGADAWLVSGNPFDVMGAISAGMKGAWVKRSPEAVFDPWGIDPTITVSGLGELPEKLSRTSG